MPHRPPGATGTCRRPRPGRQWRSRRPDARASVGQADPRATAGVQPGVRGWHSPCRVADVPASPRLRQLRRHRASRLPRRHRPGRCGAGTDPGRGVSATRRPTGAHQLGGQPTPLFGRHLGGALRRARQRAPTTGGGRRRHRRILRSEPQTLGRGGGASTRCSSPTTRTPTSPSAPGWPDTGCCMSRTRLRTTTTSSDALL